MHDKINPTVTATTPMISQMTISVMSSIRTGMGVILD